jgi:hypothetical protein
MGQEQSAESSFPLLSENSVEINNSDPTSSVVTQTSSTPFIPWDKTPKNAQYYYDKLFALKTKQDKKIEAGAFSKIGKHSKSIYKFDDGIIDELINVDYSMWAEVFNCWGELNTWTHWCKECIGYMIFTSEFLIEIIKRKPELISSKTSLGRKVCYVMSITKCHMEVGSDFHSNFVVDKLLATLTSENFHLYTQIFNYLIYATDLTQYVAAKENYKWLELVKYIEFSKDQSNKQLRQYFINIVTQNHMPTNILCELLLFPCNSDEQYEKMINACVTHLVNVDYLAVVSQFLSHKNIFIPKDEALMIKIFEMLLVKYSNEKKIELTKIRYNINLCKIKYFAEFFLANGASPYFLAVSITTKGLYEAFNMMLHIGFCFRNGNDHPYSFRPIILDYIKIGKGSCVDFFNAHHKIMSTENFNELIHVAIEQAETNPEDIKLFIAELDKRGVKTNPDIFLCSQNAHIRFSNILSKHYYRICIY